MSALPAASDLQFGMTRERVELIKNSICKGASDDELKLFLVQCERTKLDAFSRQIYSVPRGGKHQIQVSIDGFRVIAVRTGEADGQLGPFWCGSDGIWKDVWLSPKPPEAAKIGILRKGHREPYWGVARWGAYSQESAPTWKKMPDVMLAKCAEALGLRKAFPNDLSGLYTDDEMPDSNAPEPTTKPEPKTITATIAPADSQSETQFISGEQQKTLFTEMHKFGWLPSELGEFLKGKFAKNSSKDLTQVEFDRTLKHMEANKRGK